MELSRRDILKSLPSGVVGLKYVNLALEKKPSSEACVNDWIHDTLNRAIDAAVAHGAVYADVRITRTIAQSLNGLRFSVGDSEFLSIGVRARIDSSWGFSSSSVVDMENAAYTAERAVDQALKGGGDLEHMVSEDLYPAATGEWESHIEIDPFNISLEEKMDFMRSWWDLASQYRYNVSPLAPEMMFYRQERYFASSTGSLIKQRITESQGVFGVAVGNGRQIPVRMHTKGLVNAGKGWEMFTKGNIIDQLPEIVEEGIRRLAFRIKPVEVGRFPVVLDSQTAASILNSSIGVASQLDRALGLEANSVGTGYLGPDPYSFLGNLNVASNLINVKANRSKRHLLSTVGWDDDGVKPIDFDIVREGKLVNYQTTKETAPFLKAWYTKNNFEQGSNGCSVSQSAEHIPIQGSSNLELTGAASGTRISDMISGIENGLVVTEGRSLFDYQGRSGTVTGLFQRIRNGKLAEVWSDAAILFDSADWNNVAATGVEEESDVIAVQAIKGEPTQRLRHSVSSVPLMFDNIAVIDRSRKA